MGFWPSCRNQLNSAAVINILVCFMGGWYVDQYVGLWFECGRGDWWLLFVSLKLLYMGIMKEDVSWH